MDREPSVSIVIAAYQPGDAFERVIASLDAQTLPQEEFETVVVDDGSPDDTVERLRAYAATRPNLRVERIENSGWPSRPRNVGIGLARGEYVLFMDHDDSLYPDALRRMVEYARETGADLLSPKESKTTDAWWNMPTLVRGNLPDVKRDGGIAWLLPMVPHKLYRRTMLLEHGIAFPEGRRRLWEDIYVNAAAWSAADRVAVLADTPVYLWHASATNNSKSYGPRTAEYWDRLDELVDFIGTALAGDEEARRTLLLHQYQGRVLGRLSRSLADATPEEADAALGRARAIQDRAFPGGWDARLAPFDRARAGLLRAGRGDLLAALAAVDADVVPRVTATSAVWRDGALRIGLEATWATAAGEPLRLRREGERVLRDLPPELAAALPDDVVDLAATIGGFRLGVGVRDRAASVTWLLPGEQGAEWRDVGEGRVEAVAHATVALDPATAALGGALEDAVHDLVAGVEWNAADYRVRPVQYAGEAAPAVVGGRPAVAYRSNKGALALDLSSGLRNVLADGGAPTGEIAGTPAALSLPMPRIATAGAARLPAAARLRGADRPDDVVELPGVLVVDDGGARLEVGTAAKVRAGAYELSYRVGDRPFFGKRPVQVRGRTVTIVPKGGAAQPTPSAGVLGALRRRLGG